MTSFTINFSQICDTKDNVYDSHLTISGSIVPRPMVFLNGFLSLNAWNKVYDLEHKLKIFWRFNLQHKINQYSLK